MDYWAHYFSETTNSHQYVTSILIPPFGHLSDKKRMHMPHLPSPHQKNRATTHTEYISIHSLQVRLVLELQAEDCGLPICHI